MRLSLLVVNAELTNLDIAVGVGYSKLYGIGKHGVEAADFNTLFCCGRSFKYFCPLAVVAALDAV